MALLQNRSLTALLGGLPSGGGGVSSVGGVSASGFSGSQDLSGGWLDFDLGGLAILSSTSIGWTLSDADTGEITYQGSEDFSGTVVASVSFRRISSTSTVDFRIVRNGIPTSDAVVSANLMGVGTEEVTIVTPLTMETGDTLRMQLNSTGGGDGRVHEFSMQAFGAVGGTTTGNVFGPESATDNALARFDSTSGTVIKDSADLLFDGTSVTVDGKILARKAVNVTEVFSADDLPAPSGGVITLPSGIYVIKDAITLSDPIKVGAGATVELVSEGAGTIVTYTGTDPFFQSDLTALFLIVNTAALVLTEDNVELFDTDGPSILVERTTIVFLGSGSGLGTSINHDLIFTLRNSRISGFTEGGSFSGSPILSLSSIALESLVLGSTPIFSVNGGTTTLECDNLTINANVADEIWYIDPAFAGFATLNRISNVGGSDFFGVGSLDETSPRVSVSESPPQKSSMNIGFMTANGNSTASDIETTGVFIDLNLAALAVAGSNIELWSVSDTTTGELTYNGLIPFNGSILATLTASSAGAADEFAFRAVKNGSPFSDGITAGRQIGGIAVSITLLAPVTAEPGDTIRIQVANISAVSDVTVEQISAQVT